MGSIPPVAAAPVATSGSPAPSGSAHYAARAAKRAQRRRRRGPRVRRGGPPTRRSGSWGAPGRSPWSTRTPPWRGRCARRRRPRGTGGLERAPLAADDWPPAPGRRLRAAGYAASYRPHYGPNAAGRRPQAADYWPHAVGRRAMGAYARPATTDRRLRRLLLAAYDGPPATGRMLPGRIRPKVEVDSAIHEPRLFRKIGVGGLRSTDAGFDRSLGRSRPISSWLRPQSGSGRPLVRSDEQPASELTNLIGPGGDRQITCPFVGLVLKIGLRSIPARGLRYGPRGQ